MKVPLDLELFGQFNGTRQGGSGTSVKVPEALTENFRTHRLPETTTSSQPLTSTDSDEKKEAEAAKEEDTEDVVKLKAENSALNKLLEAFFNKPASDPALVQVSSADQPQNWPSHE